MSEIEALVYETRRRLAALVGGAEPPVGTVRPLFAGLVVTVVLVAVETARAMR